MWLYILRIYVRYVYSVRHLFLDISLTETFVELSHETPRTNIAESCTRCYHDIILSCR